SADRTSASRISASRTSGHQSPESRQPCSSPSGSWWPRSWQYHPHRAAFHECPNPPPSAAARNTSLSPATVKITSCVTTVPADDTHIASALVHCNRNYCIAQKAASKPFPGYQPQGALLHKTLILLRFRDTRRN